MGITVVRSPHTSERGVDPRPQEGISPGAYSSPSNAPRTDSAPDYPPRPAGKPVPAVGGNSAAELEAALDAGLRRGDRR